MMLSILCSRNVINSINKLQIARQILVKNVNYKNAIFYKSFHSSSRCKFKIENTRKDYKEAIEMDLLTLNTNVQNNVLLYKYENTKDFLILKLIFFGWLFCNTAMLLISYSPKYISRLYENLSWKEYFRQNGTNFIYFLFSTLIGPWFVLLLYVINAKCVKYIVLHKGGEKVSIVSNHLIKTLCTTTIPVDKVKVQFSRQSMKNYLPMKVKGQWLHFYVDSQGQFVNKKLFDYTVGKAKSW